MATNETTTTSKRVRTVAQELASLCQARKNCIANGNHDWETSHTESIRKIVKEYLPSGSGIDNGTYLDVDASGARSLSLSVAFHHMNEDGMYDGWTSHEIKVVPSFDGVDLKISGKNRNQIKEYLYETYHYALTQEIEIW